MPDESPNFAGLLQTLHTHNVRFVLVGGLAMVAYGAAHLTEDIPVVYSRDADNLRAVVRALAPLHASLRGIAEDVPFVLDERSLSWSLNLTLRTDAGSVALLAAVPGVESFQGLWERATVMTLFGIAVRVASLDDLLTMKRAAGRPKDLAHLPEPEALKRLAEKPVG